ncbi:MAG: IPT/TIG domain-containing protein [Terracidiphilus sp.]
MKRIAFNVFLPLLCIVSAAIVAHAATTVTVSPGYTNLGVDATLKYTATVKGLTDTTVKWEINGILGGNPKVGTITQAGLYKAPAAIPAVSILVEAIAADETIGCEYVNIEPAGPTITAVSPKPLLTGNPKLTLTGSGFQKGATVSFNGGNMGTTYVNATTLTTAIYVSSPGTGTLRVSNPGTLWGPAFTVTFVHPQSIAPDAATVKLGHTRQFTSAGATSWKATAGTISSSGLYTAPATMPASNSVKVTATGPGGSASAVVTLVALEPQVISPASASVTLGLTQLFTSSGATSWTATAGTVSSSGLYKAPATMPASSKVTVTATAPGGSASAVVTLLPVAPQTIAPITASLDLGAKLQFTSAGATSWSATYGTVTSSGLYGAPATWPASGTDKVTATGPGGSATALVTVIDSVQTTISPTSASLKLGATQQFTTNTGTTWSATFGAVSSTGLYTAPASLPASAQDVVVVSGVGGTASAANPARNFLHDDHRERLHPQFACNAEWNGCHHNLFVNRFAHHLGTHDTIRRSHHHRKQRRSQVGGVQRAGRRAECIGKRGGRTQIP